MKPTRKLALQREVLQDLTTDELRAVVGGEVTLFSCLTYVSCNPLACILETALC